MTHHEQLLTDHLNQTAANTNVTFTIDDVRNQPERQDTGSNATGRFAFAVAACLTGLLGVATFNLGGGNDNEDVAAGLTVDQLDPSDEVIIRAVEPNPSSDSYIWTAAYGIDGIDPLDSVNVGRVGPAELANDPVEGSEDRVCRGTVWMRSISCDAQPGPKPVRFDGGSLEIGAWLWTNLPEGTAIVQFTDQNGDTFWQRPLDGTVLFADTAENDDGQQCPCMIVAVDDDGNVIDLHQLG